MSAVPEPWEDDERLLRALQLAVRDAAPPPHRVVEAAKAVYTWRTVDADLAALAYDSAMDELAGQVRSSGPVRTLSFSADDVHVEVEVGDDGLVGQLVPPGAGRIELWTAEGQVAAVTADELGCFCISPRPSGPVTLRCRLDSGVVIATEWLPL